MIPTEHQEQVNLFTWVEVNQHRYPDLAKMFAIPNGGDRHIVVAAKLKAEGVRKGVPDIFLPVARLDYHGMFIEMKRLERGRLSADQRLRLNQLHEDGYYCVVAYGWVHAVNVICVYLGIPETIDD